MALNNNKKKDGRFRSGETLRSEGGEAVRCPIPGAAGGSQGRGQPELSRRLPGSRCRRSRAASAGGYRNCSAAPSAAGSRAGRGAGGSGAGGRLFFSICLFFFFFFSTRKARENPTKPPAQMFEGISAKPECCKAVPADAGGFAGVPGSELDQVLKQTCSEESGKMQRDMHCFG